MINIVKFFYFISICFLGLDISKSEVYEEICNTNFTDEFSSLELSQIVIVGEISKRDRYNFNKDKKVKVREVIKGKELIKVDDVIKIGKFSNKSEPENCIFRFNKNKSKFIFFLNSSSFSPFFHPKPFHYKPPGFFSSYSDPSTYYLPQFKMIAFPKEFLKSLVKDLNFFACNKTNEKPSIKITNSKLGLKEGEWGEDLTIECRTTNFPLAIFLWFYKNKLITNSSKYEVINRKKESKLRIKSFKHTEEGNYVCEATNLFGTSNVSIETVAMYLDQKIAYDHTVRCPNHLDNGFCFHNSTCLITVFNNFKHCLCREGYVGIRCENFFDYEEVKIHETNGFYDVLKVPAIIFSVVILFLFLFSFVILLIFEIKNRKSDKPPYMLTPKENIRFFS